jgi:hypothetical protein
MSSVKCRSKTRNCNALITTTVTRHVGTRLYGLRNSTRCYSTKQSHILASFVLELSDDEKKACYRRLLHIDLILRNFLQQCGDSPCVDGLMLCVQSFRNQCQRATSALAVILLLVVRNAAKMNARRKAPAYACKLSTVIIIALLLVCAAQWVYIARIVTREAAVTVAPAISNPEQISGQGAKAGELAAWKTIEAAPSLPSRLRAPASDDRSAVPGGSTHSAAGVTTSFPTTPWFADVPTLPILPPATYTPGFFEYWRSGSLDWHDVVPPLPSRLLGSESGAAGSARWDALVASELGVLSVLQGFVGRPPNPYASPGNLTGPLTAMSLCPLLRDPCLLASTMRACVLDERCGWCPSVSACMYRGQPYKVEKETGSLVPICSQPLLVLLSSVQDPRFNPPRPGDPPSEDTTEAIAMDLYSSSLDSARIYRGYPSIQANCDIYVSSAKHTLVSITGNAKMAYHFYTENAPDLLRNVGSDTLLNHIYVTPDSSQEFLPTLQVFSSSCWLYSDALSITAGAQLGISNPPRVCYASTARELEEEPQVVLWDPTIRKPVAGKIPSTAVMETESEAISKGMRVGPLRMAELIKKQNIPATNIEGQPITPTTHASDILSMVHSTYPSAIISLLGLTHVYPNRPLVTLISRRNKRVILNEPELVRILRSMHVDVVVASLETMPLYEQVLLFRRTSVLVGMHGSGLINSIFMHPGTALVQLMPYKVASGGSFFQFPAEERGVHYFEWMNPNKDKSVFHWHFLGDDYATRRDDILSQGSGCCGQNIYFSFWINQDTWVDEAAFTSIISKALRTPVNQRLMQTT